MRLSAFIYVLLTPVFVQAQDTIFNIIFSQDFEHCTPGVYRHNEWKQDWNSPSFVNNLEHTYIVKTGEDNQAMKWVYPKGSVGPEQGGGQFEATFGTRADEIYMSYNLQFRPGFNWVLGGKLPGLKGGPQSYYTGVKKPAWDDGFSNGLMWGHGYFGPQDEGSIYFYTFFQDMYGLYGDSFRWDNFRFQTDPARWYNITIRMVMNTVRNDGSGGNFDGIMEGFVDGKLFVSKTGLRFRNVKTVHIDKMKIYSHFGGTGPEFGAARDEWLLLDDVCLFTYAAGADVPRGNTPSQPGRVLLLPNMAKIAAGISADHQPPAPPSGLNASAVTEHSFTLSWEPSSDNTSITEYRVSINDSLLGTIKTTHFTVTGLEPAQAYTASVRAIDAAGNPSEPSEALRVSTAGPDHQAPAVPQGLAVTHKSENGLDISWEPSTDNTEVAGYHIYLNGAAYATTTTRHFSLHRLNPNTSYEIAVSAFDVSSNESPLSGKISAKTTLTDTEPPTVPEGLTVAGKTMNAITITWKPSTDNEKVAGYVIFVNGSVRTTCTGTTFRLQGLAPGTSYALSVAAFDAHSNKSQASGEIRVKTRDSQ